MRRALRGYAATAALAASAVGDSPLFLMDYALRLLRVVVLVGLWRVILEARGGEDGVPLGAVLTYTVVAEAFARQLTVETTLADAYWEGTVVMHFLQPIGIVGQFVAEMVGRWAVHLALFSVPLLLVAAPLLGVDPRPASPRAGGLFVVGLGLGVTVGVAVDFAFNALTVALEQPVWLVRYLRRAVGTLLSGAVLPLAVYPWGLGQVFGWLPFAASAWAPLAIYTGLEDPLPLLGRQVVWAAALWPAALWLWQRNRQRVIAYGG